MHLNDALINRFQFPQLSKLNSQDDYFCGFGQGLVCAGIEYSQLQKILIRVEFCMHNVKISENNKFSEQFGHHKISETFLLYSDYFSPLPIVTTCDLAAEILMLLLDNPVMRRTENP